MSRSKDEMRTIAGGVKPDACTISAIDTDYPERPEHRGHTVQISGWNDEYAMLIIHSDDRTNEALVTPAQLRQLADDAEREVGKW